MKQTTNGEVESIKDALLRRRIKPKISSKDLLSTGSTLLNLACTGNSAGGFIKGGYYFLVGDSDSGKTWLSLTCLAEASINKNFANYRFIYDGPEGGALMDIEAFFGRRVLERLEPPEVQDGEPVHSSTIESFYYHVDDAVQAGKPFIYILDSMDCLGSEKSLEEFHTGKKAHLRGKPAPGSYGDGKANKNSQNLRWVVDELRRTRSILIVIDQTRDNLNPVGYADKKTRSGGRALTFYATLEMWSSVKKRITKEVKDKKRQLGIEAQIRVRKNRVNGRSRTVVVPIFHSFGIDDMGSCVDYLLEEKHWKKTRGKIRAEEFDFVGSREAIIAMVESDNLERELQKIVAQVWNDIEMECVVKRKNKYE